MLLRGTFEIATCEAYQESEKDLSEDSPFGAVCINVCNANLPDFCRTKFTLGSQRRRPFFHAVNSRKLRLIRTTKVPANTCSAGRAACTPRKTAVMPLKDKCRATMLDAATALISAAVPKPIDITAIAPAILISICQVITNRKIAPVQGRTAMLSTSPKASCIELTFKASSGVGP